MIQQLNTKRPLKHRSRLARGADDLVFSWRALAIGPRWPPLRSVLDGDAGNLGALQRPAHGFGLIAVEAGEAGAKQLAVTFGDHRFGERVGLAEQATGLVARGVDAFARFAFAL